MFLILYLDHSQEALEMARIQETTKQLEQQKKIKVNLHILLTQLAAPGAPIAKAAADLGGSRGFGENC